MSTPAAPPSLPPPRDVTDTVASPHRLAMGLSAVDADESWLELDARLAEDLALKRKLLAERRDDVFVELPGSRDAQRDALDVVVGALLRHFPAHYARLSDGRLRVGATGDVLDPSDASAPPLELAARCVQEDLCVMERGGRGWCLTAGAVCFPTRWRLRPMLGLPMTAIHDRVPGYREALDRSAIRFFDGMKGGAVFRRGNWSLMDDPALFQQEGRRCTDLARPGDQIWLRVEHQTLQRLPRTGAVLFGIRVHRTRLGAAARDRETARALLGAIDTMDPAMQRYKSLALVRDAAVAYLEARLAPAG